MTAFDTTETEQTFLIGQSWNGLYRDRYSYQRDTLLEEAIRAWRLNPLARRLTNLFKIYNVDGIGYKCEDTDTQKFLDEFWNHELNNMDDMLEEISNELFLTGNLFPAYSVGMDGMTFVRIFPTDQIHEIVTAPNDLRQEQAYITKPLSMDVESKTFFNLPTAPVFMRHHAINRLAGTVWGEGEIWSDLPWLGRYASFLEDRVRLNRYRQAFIYDVSVEGMSPDQIKARKAEIQRNPPASGSVNVHDANETWDIKSPKLDSGDAERDGLAIKKMIAVNHVPMHYLAEPESSTRTTADAAGTPTFKAFENHQDTFKKIIKNILQTAVKRKSEKDAKVSTSAKIEIIAGDATERDNAALALGTSQIVQSIGELYDRKLLDESEYLRLVYRFAGETLPDDFKAPKGIRKPVVKQPDEGNQPANGLTTDKDTGDVKIK
jgi:hypothetical protein